MHQFSSGLLTEQNRGLDVQLRSGSGHTQENYKTMKRITSGAQLRLCLISFVFAMQ